jgi:hypothetical protein
MLSGFSPVRKANTTLSGVGVGANLLTVAPTTGAGVVWNSGTGTATCTGASEIIRWAGVLVPGKTYVMTFNYNLTSGSKLRITSGAAVGNETIVFVSGVLGAGAGTITAFFTALHDTIAIEADTAVYSGTVSAIVAKDGAATIATSTGVGGAGVDRVVQGKTYFEAVPTTLTGTPQIGISGWSLWPGTNLATGTTSLGYLPSGAVQTNSVTLATIATWVQGDRIDCALDPINHLIWFRVNGGNWNNNVANDPATGVGGIDYSSMPTLSTLQLTVFASVTGNVWTAAFSSASWVGAAPSGYSSLDTILYTIANNVDVTYEITQATTMYGGPVVRAIPTPNDRFKKWFSPAGLVTTVSGVIRELSVAVPNRRVDVYDRITGELLGTTVSAGDGSWSIPCLGRPSVRIVASDPTTYNSLALDNVAPA